MLLDHLKHVDATQVNETELIAAKQASQRGVALSLRQRLSIATTLQAFKNQNLWAYRHPNCKRFFTSFSGAPKVLRRRLAYQGEPLVSLDVKQCHPVLLEKILSDYIWENISIYMDLFDLATNKRKKRKKSFLSAVENDGFYRLFYSVFPKSKSNKEKKKMAKTGFCRMTYGKPDHGCLLSPFAQRFKKLFPQYFHVLKEMKAKVDRTDFPGLKRYHNYKQFSWRLMAMEAECVIDGVCEGVLEDGSRAPILTVHDAICTTPQYADEVEERLKSSFFQRYGVKVRIERELSAVPIQPKIDSVPSGSGLLAS